MLTKFTRLLLLSSIALLSVGCDEMSPSEAHQLWQDQSVASYGVSYWGSIESDSFLDGSDSTFTSSATEYECSRRTKGSGFSVEWHLEHLIEASRNTACDIEAEYHSEYGFPLQYRIECDNFLVGSRNETVELIDFYFIDVNCSDNE